MCAAVHFNGANYIASCGITTSSSPLTVFARARLYDRDFNPVTNWVNVFTTKNGKIPAGPILAWDGTKYLAVTTRGTWNPTTGDFNDGAIITRFLTPPVKSDLTVYVEGAAGGLVKSMPAGINCGNWITGPTACTATFKPQATVKLTPKGKGAIFAGWSGACEAKLPCIVTMESQKAVVATFTSDPTIAVTPGVWNFGKVKTTAAKPVTQVFTITNKPKKGSADLNISAITIDSATGDFDLALGSCGSLTDITIKSTKSCTFKVTFKPTATGSQSAAITIANDDPDNLSKTITVSGAGK